jgi:thiamine-phosphate pyrophosphorylase
MSVPRLYAITDAEAGRSHVEQVAELAAAGVEWIQIRDKHLSGRALYEITRAALEVAHPRSARIIVNDRVDVAKAAGADGVHLGQDDLPADAARAILGPVAIVGLSTHSVAQAVAAAELPVDYVAIGPVYTTGTKENPDPVVGLEGVAAVRAAVALPIVAIGGITLERAPAVAAAGADAVAVIGDLRVGESLGARARAYLAALEPV